VNWTTAAPAVTTAFLSSLVEAVEALTAGTLLNEIALEAAVLRWGQTPHPI
jgi:hypothetical protein